MNAAQPTPFEFVVLLAREVQEEILQRIEIVPVELHRAVMCQYRDVALPYQLSRAS